MNYSLVESKRVRGKKKIDCGNVQYRARQQRTTAKELLRHLGRTVDSLRSYPISHLLTCGIPPENLQYSWPHEEKITRERRTTNPRASRRCQRASRLNGSRTREWFGSLCSAWRQVGDRVEAEIYTQQVEGI